MKPRYRHVFDYNRVPSPSDLEPCTDPVAVEEQACQVHQNAFLSVSHARWKTSES